MAIVSVGYDGTIGEGQWAKLAVILGKTPHVTTATAMRITTVPAVDRTVRAAPGGHGAHGVLVESDANVDVQLPTVASGVRWDTIVVRRDWTPGVGGTSTIAAVTGGPTKALAAGLANTPGSTTDTPIALVQVTAGQQVPTSVVDLRVNAAEQALTFDGAQQWALPQADTAWTSLTFPSPYTVAAGSNPRLRLYGGRAYLEGAVTKSTGDFLGGTTYTVGGLIPVGRRPGRTLTFFASRRSDGNIDGRIIVDIDGTVQMTALGNTSSIRFDGAHWFPEA